MVDNMNSYDVVCSLHSAMRNDVTRLILNTHLQTAVQYVRSNILSVGVDPVILLFCLRNFVS